MNTSRLLSSFRISSAMCPYVLRIRLRGSDFDFGSDPKRAVAYTKCIREMRRILMEKGRIPAIAADRAILENPGGGIRFSIGGSTLSFYQDDRGPVSRYS